MVNDIFEQKDILNLVGNYGVGHGNLFNIFLIFQLLTIFLQSVTPLPVLHQIQKPNPSMSTVLTV
jgi:hypothetical protein